MALKKMDWGMFHPEISGVMEPYQKTGDLAHVVGGFKIRWDSFPKKIAERFPLWPSARSDIFLCIMSGTKTIPTNVNVSPAAAQQSPSIIWSIF